MRYNIQTKHWRLRQRFIPKDIAYIDYEKMLKKYRCGHFRGHFELIVDLVIRKKRKTREIEK